MRTQKFTSFCCLNQSIHKPSTYRKYLKSFCFTLEKKDFLSVWIGEIQIGDEFAQITTIYFVA